MLENIFQGDLKKIKQHLEIYIPPLQFNSVWGTPFLSLNCCVKISQDNFPWMEEDEITQRENIALENLISEIHLWYTFHLSRWKNTSQKTTG